MDENKKAGDDCCAPKGWHFAHKAIGFIIAFALALFIGVTALGIYWPDIQEYRYKLEAERFEKQLQAEKEALETAQRNDTFGGKTPEETFDLFLDALKKGDVELASKYYDITVQVEALAGFQKELADKGNLDMSIKYFTDVRGGEKKCNETGDGCDFEYAFIEESQSANLGKSLSNKALKFTSISKNQYSGNWKIIRP